MLLLPFASAALAQRSAESIAEAVKKQGCVVLEQPGAKVCNYGYKVDGRAVDAFSFQPPGTGPFAGVLMIPGNQRTAVNLIALGVRLASEGFAAIAPPIRPRAVAATDDGLLLPSDAVVN